jgi:cupin fold WbuC family metalloprotein
MRLRKLSAEVFLADGPISTVGRAEIELLRDAVSQSPKGRVRINLHPDATDSLHEMIIAIDAHSYIRPHLHPGKSESFHIVEGIVDVVVFDEAGEIIDVVELGGPGTGRAFYYRMSSPFLHTLVVHSDILVVHETTNGPFDQNGTRFASFAPDGSDPAAAESFCVSVRERVAAYRGMNR